jgi:hypothetical protein
MGFLTQNFNTVELVKFLEKYQKLHISMGVVTSKMSSSKTMYKNKN